jgi:hypothetical protein
MLQINLVFQINEQLTKHPDSFESCIFDYPFKLLSLNMMNLINFN